MFWQDIVIAIGQWIFAIALLPTVKAKEKPALTTSMLTGSILLVFSFTFFTIPFWNAAISSLVVSILWFILMVQKYIKEIKIDNKE